MVQMNCELLQVVQVKYKVEDITFYIACGKETVGKIFEWIQVQGTCTKTHICEQ